LLENKKIENTVWFKTFPFVLFNSLLFTYCADDKKTQYGHAGAQLIEALRYKPEGRGFDSRYYHWNFLLT
jgi:hypothetical protein